MKKIYYDRTLISRKEGEKLGFFTITEYEWGEHVFQDSVAARFPELADIVDALDFDDIYETLVEDTDYICGFEYFDSDAWPMTLYKWRDDITSETIASILNKHKGEK